MCHHPRTLYSKSMSYCPVATAGEKATWYFGKESFSGQAQDHMETLKSPPSIGLPCDSSIEMFSALDFW